ncbi:MAG: hypothetical protein K8R63_04680 [Bacteroidales bacterium]|nr:hypothetical protein [Bacteroidales bacterium]
MSNEILKDVAGEDQEFMKLSPISMKYLDTTRKWALFLAIIGFIGLGVLILITIFMMVFSATIGNFPGPGIPFVFLSFIYLFFAVVYFFPVYYLLKFATNMKNAVLQKNEITLDEAFRFLKNHYLFIGILMIIIIALYALIFIGMMVAGIAAGL